MIYTAQFGSVTLLLHRRAQKVTRGAGINTVLWARCADGYRWRSQLMSFDEVER